MAHDVTEKVQLSLRVGDQKLTQCFYILRQNQYDIIVGMDFIRQHQVKMDFSFSNPEITIAGQKHYLQPPPTRSMLAKTLSVVTIMGYSAMDVPVKLSKSLKTHAVPLMTLVARFAPDLRDSNFKFKFKIALLSYIYIMSNIQRVQNCR